MSIKWLRFYSRNIRIFCYYLSVCLHRFMFVVVLVAGKLKEVTLKSSTTGKVLKYGPSTGLFHLEDVSDVSLFLALLSNSRPSTVLCYWCITASPYGSRWVTIRFRLLSCHFDEETHCHCCLSQQQRAAGFYCHNRFLDNSLNKTKATQLMMVAVFWFLQMNVCY